MLGKENLDADSSPFWMAEGADVYDDGHLRVEHNKFYVSCAGKPLYDLTRKEFLILSSLVRGAGRPVTKQEIWGSAWGNQTRFNYDTFRVHIASLRRKLSPCGLDVVAVVHVGYRLGRTAEIGKGEGQLTSITT